MAVSEAFRRGMAPRLHRRDCGQAVEPAVRLHDRRTTGAGMGRELLVTSSGLMHHRAMLGAALSSSVWRSRALPFPHLVADDVFAAPVYERLVAAFRRRFAEAETGQQITHTRNYKADIVALRDEDRKEFPVLLDRPWHDLLAHATGVAHSGEIDAALHRHPIGSQSGWVHTDFMAAWFRAPAAPGETLIGVGDGVAALASKSSRVERVRALATILFVDNHWSEGAGGETGLYRHAHQMVERPDVRIAPRSNSLLAFECTPHSYHSFLLNTRYPRHSIILWLHRSREATAAKWGNARVR